MKSFYRPTVTSLGASSALRPRLPRGNLVGYAAQANPHKQTYPEGDEPAPSQGDDNQICEFDIVTYELICTPKPDAQESPERIIQQEEPVPADRQSTTTSWRGDLGGAGMETGFPVPTSYASTRNDGYNFFGRSRMPVQKQQPLTETPGMSGGEAASPGRTYLGAEEGQTSSSVPLKPILPVFRTSPYRAESRKRKNHSQVVRILFVDEGNTFRSVLAAAFFKLMLSKLRSPLSVIVETASIGPATRGGHDERIIAVATEMGLQLEPRTARQFDEVADAVNSDMVIVMDSFDYQEILKEVAVLDTINPNGHYSTRIRLLGPFGMAAKRATPGRVSKDIQDTLYGIPESIAAEKAAVRSTAKELAFACRGLLDYLLLLRQRSGPGVTLRTALAQSLQCPLLEGGVMPGRDRLTADFRPVWREGNYGSEEEVDEYYTIRVINGERKVVRRREKQRGYWREIDNIEMELKAWMQQHGVLNRLPTQQELRKSGASSLASAVDQVGGLAVFSARLGIAMTARRPNGYWDSFDNLADALQPYLLPVHHTSANSLKKNSAASTASASAISTHGNSVVGSSPIGTAAPLMPDQSYIAGDSFMMPTQQQLMDAGRADLLRAVRQHGGSAAVAKKLGVGVRRSKVRRESDVLEELLLYVEERGTGNSMPSKIELESSGRVNLSHAIHRLGGFKHFSQLAGLEFKGTRGTSALMSQGGGGTSTKNAVGSSSSNHNLHGYKTTSQPTLDRVLHDGSSSGTNSEIELEFELPAVVKNRPSSSDLVPTVEPLIESVGRQVLDWIQANAAPAQVPTHQQLLESNRGDLWVLIQRCGGVRRLSEHLEIPFVETRGRRAKQGSLSKQQQCEEIDGVDAVGDAKQEIDLVDAYEEFVLI